MKKVYTTLVALCVIAQFTYAQSTAINSTAAGSVSNDVFTYSGHSVGNYSLGWYYEPTSAYPPTGYLSAYNGLKFFTAGLPRGTFDINGNLGIGTTAPSEKLQVNGAIKTTSSVQTNTASSGVLDFYTGNTRLGSFGANSSTYGGFQFINFTSTGASIIPFSITPSGDVSIGTTDPRGYKLAVNGNAIATSITVQLHSAWPDYVFKSAYELPTLTEVKTYIDKNQHLSDMPSASEVEKNGINLGEIVKVQTKKIEELTLYAIEKDEQITELRTQNVEQRRINQHLQEQINELVKKIK